MAATTDPSVPVATGNEATHVRVVVVGAGLAGIAAAVKLKQARITDYVVLEKADRVGGTWRENTYPGCGCDIPAPVYSFSFNPKPQWRKNFALQPEILAYINDTVDKFALQPKIRLSTELIDARGRKFATWPFRRACFAVGCPASISRTTTQCLLRTRLTFRQSPPPHNSAHGRPVLMRRCGVGGVVLVWVFGAGPSIGVGGTRGGRRCRCGCPTRRGG